MFKQNETLSKNALSWETGLSFSTINRLVDRLVEAG
ncbi:winged helix-turn-helix domain-containing protein [uncultured Robinsoniella sp.]